MKYDAQSSGAFVETFETPPYTKGALDGLRFAVKDNIDLRGRRTSYGNKSWYDAHPPAANNAVCVEQLLADGARCVGKTITDEFTYSLDGESHFYGTPVNPLAPDRIPGGSSSGSASAVACGLVDFALGTDCGGSIRLPASLCGVYGMRPSTHRISEAGVLPFSPSVSTVGVLARSIPVLRASMRTLLSSAEAISHPITHIYLLEDSFAAADPSIRQAMEVHIDRLRMHAFTAVIPITLSQIVGMSTDLTSINEEAVRTLQTMEIANTIGGWIRANNPELGRNFQESFRNVEEFDRSTAQSALKLCRKMYQLINKFLSPGSVFCFPTAPVLAPKKGMLTGENIADVLDYYNRSMSVTSFSGVGKLPEITLPVTHVDGLPVGISFAAGHNQDEFLLEGIQNLWDILQDRNSD